MGLAEARLDELAKARELAARLINPGVASTAALLAIHARTGYGIYVVREAGEVTGFVALVFLNAAGLAAVETDTFNTLRPSLDHITAAGEEPVACYGWGVAAATREAAAICIAGCQAAAKAMPFAYFARAVTPSGHRALTEKVGFVPYPGSKSGLLWLSPNRKSRSAA
ncbi:MAG TPA: hypothetical protein VD906_00405 [Caulobacteraceae bacterium]|nr:hypothetical protein [Caulobacteraceae bacterium]